MESTSPITGTRVCNLTFALGVVTMHKMDDLLYEFKPQILIAFAIIGAFSQILLKTTGLLGLFNIVSIVTLYYLSKRIRDLRRNYRRSR